MTTTLLASATALLLGLLMLGWFVPWRWRRRARWALLAIVVASPAAFASGVGRFLDERAREPTKPTEPTPARPP